MAAPAHPQAYVAIGAGGLLKVGFTTQAKKRGLGLRKDFKSKGDVLMLMYVCDAIEAAHAVESELIRHCAKTYQQHSGREWFVAGDFDATVAAAVKFTDKWRHHKYPKMPTPEELEAIHQRRERQEAERKAARAEREAHWAKQAVAWHAKRNRARNVIDQIVSFALSSQS